MAGFRHEVTSKLSNSPSDIFEDSWPTLQNDPLVIQAFRRNYRPLTQSRAFTAHPILVKALF